MPPKTPECKAAQYSGPLPALGRDGVTLYTIVEDTRRGGKAWRVVKAGNKKKTDVVAATSTYEEKNIPMSSPSQQQQQTILYQPTFLPTIGQRQEQQQQQHQQENKMIRVRKTYFPGQDTLFSNGGNQQLQSMAPPPLPTITTNHKSSVIDMDMDMEISHPHFVGK